MTTKTAFPLEIKSLTDEGFFEGYASVSGNVDLGGDIVVPGAFTKSIAATPEVPLLWSHDHAEVIGAIREMQEDGHGLRVKGEIALETARGKEAYALLKKNMMKGLSIGYQVVSDSVANGKRLLKELTLLEVSVVPLPINQMAQVTAVKTGDVSPSATSTGTKRMNEEVLAQSLGELVSELKSFQTAARTEIAESKVVADGTKANIEALQKEIGDLNTKLSAVEQKYAAKHAPISSGNTNDGLSVGQKFVGSTQFQAMVANGLSHSGKVELKALTTLEGSSNFGPRFRDGIVRLPQQSPVVRDFINVIPVSESSVEYVKETSFTNSAALQYVSPSYENVAKPESDIAFSLATAPIRTIAHFLKASKQVLADNRQLAAIIDSELMNGLRLVEEYQILRGAGTAGNLNGIIPQATAYDTGLNQSGDTVADKVLHAIYQVSLSKNHATAVFVHPSTVHALMALKTTGTASSGEYIFSNPASTTNIPTVWGLPLVGTLTMDSGKFLVGNFGGATLYDREQASVAVSTEDGSNFTTNMVTILCEERVGLAVRVPAGFVYGTF